MDIEKRKKQIIIRSIVIALLLFGAALVITGYAEKKIVTDAVDNTFTGIRQGLDDATLEMIIDNFIYQSCSNELAATIIDTIQNRVATGEDINDVYHALISRLDWRVTGVERIKFGTEYRVGVTVINIDNITVGKRILTAANALRLVTAEDRSQMLAALIYNTGEELLSSGEVSYFSNDFVITIDTGTEANPYDVENGRMEMLLTCAGIPCYAETPEPVQDPGVTPIFLCAVLIILVTIVVDHLLIRRLESTDTSVVAEQTYLSQQDQYGSLPAEKRLAIPEQATVPVQTPQRAVLCSLSDQHGGMMIALHGEPVLIGRDPAVCKVTFRDGTTGVSGRHCSVTYDSQDCVFLLTDLQSTYGTYLIDGRRVQPGEQMRLTPGNGFYVGDPSNAFRVEVR